MSVERLTTTSDKGGLAFTFDLDVTCTPNEARKIVALGERLKAYEDTGLPPEEVAALKDELARMTAERDAVSRDLCNCCKTYADMDGCQIDCVHCDRWRGEPDIRQGDLHMESVETALIALHERAERTKGCDFCNAKYAVMSGSKITANGSHKGCTAMYCPNCGKRLEVKQDG